MKRIVGFYDHHLPHYQDHQHHCITITIIIMVLERGMGILSYFLCSASTPDAGMLIARLKVQQDQGGSVLFQGLEQRLVQSESLTMDKNSFC